MPRMAREHADTLGSGGERLRVCAGRIRIFWSGVVRAVTSVPAPNQPYANPAS